MGQEGTVSMRAEMSLGQQVKLRRSGGGQSPGTGRWACELCTGKPLFQKPDKGSTKLRR